jgi:iron-sulfur cluster assembly protein
MTFSARGSRLDDRDTLLRPHDRKASTLIIVTEEAKALLSTIEHPEGTVLRLDPVAQDQATEQITLSFAPGEPHDDDQIVEQEGEEVLRIAAPVSGLLNGSTMDVMVQQEESENGAERPSVVIGIRPPGHEPPTEGS